MLIDLERLNPQQRKAVEDIEGPVLVVAGAGSGKTKVITTRIMHLMQSGISPYQILAMTFTNKAAQEMKARIAASLGFDKARDLTISTFHSFCARFLRREIEYLGRDNNFVIYDTQDQTACLKRVLRQMELPEKTFPAQRYRNLFSNLKNSGKSNPEPEAEIERELFNNYQEEMLSQNAMDFDDLLLLTVQILAEVDEVRERYHKRFLHIMVDEYQDTNHIQARLIRLLLNSDNNLCVVGDEDQSIYGWRGADIRNILEFDEAYPGTKIYKLEQNYRSTQRILDYANQVISENKLRKPKALWTEHGKGDPILIRDEMDSKNEAETIVQKIQETHHKEDMSYSDFAVLFRSNYLSRVLEEMFRKYQIPYQLIGGLKFYDRKEIKDILSFMRIVVNNRDWTSFIRALSVPSRGIGQKSQDKLQSLFTKGYTIPQVVKEANQKGLLSGRGKKGLAEFAKLYELLIEEATRVKPSQWLKILIDELGFIDYLEKIDEVGADNRAANVEELLVSIQDLEKQGVESLAQFMDFSALVSDQDDFDENEPTVSLMTVHSAKGLEFEHVFVMGLEEGVFPNQRAVEADSMEEERRLFYVAVTRAKQKLCLSYARRRQTYGTFVRNPKSQFLEMPLPIYDEENVQAPQPKKKNFMSLGDMASQINRMEAQLQAQGKPIKLVETEAAASPKTGSDNRFKPGDGVKHAKFGTGTVSSVMGSGDLMKVTVYFPGRGVKSLIAKVAKLEKLDR